MSVESAPDPTSTIFHNCGNEGPYKNGCTVCGKIYDKRNNGHAQKSKKSGRKARDTTTKWCSPNKTTLHNNADCFKQGASRQNEGRVFSDTAFGAHSFHFESGEKAGINFDGGFRV